MDTQTGWPSGLAVAQVRVARPTDRLAEIETFYSTDLGLPVLYRFEDHAGYTGLMVGLPGTDYHLEFTSHVDGSPCPAPTADNLLVLYFHNDAQMYDVVERLAAAGHEPVVGWSRRVHLRGSRRLAGSAGADARLLGQAVD